LLETARRRFAADGAIAATLDEIRRDAEASVSALYHHFPDKPAPAARRRKRAGGIHRHTGGVVEAGGLC
jgi:AcrR family transcriptional regulator